MYFSKSVPSINYCFVYDIFYISRVAEGVSAIPSSTVFQRHNGIPISLGSAVIFSPASSTHLLPKRLPRVTLTVTLAGSAERERGQAPSFGSAGNSVAEPR